MASRNCGSQEAEVGETPIRHFVGKTIRPASSSLVDNADRTWKCSSNVSVSINTSFIKLQMQGVLIGPKNFPHHAIEYYRSISQTKMLKVELIMAFLGNE